MNHQPGDRIGRAKKGKKVKEKMRSVLVHIPQGIISVTYLVSGDSVNILWTSFTPPHVEIHSA
jgi:hypothetical protein